MDLTAVRATTEDIAVQAGQVIMRYYGTEQQQSLKGSIYDVVTEGDHAADAFIVAALRDAYPDHHIISEEGGGAGADPATADYFWHIDPIDGTANFAHGLPHFSVSIALADRTGQPLVGVVHHPVNGDVYAAARGHGAVRNGSPLRVSTTPEISQGLFATGFPANPTVKEQNVDLWRRFELGSRGVRRLGSAALDICYVAAGWLDGFWEMRVHSWDVLAALLCAEEAGGATSDFAGTKTDLYNGVQVVATNGVLHSAVLDLLTGRATTD